MNTLLPRSILVAHHPADGAHRVSSYVRVDGAYRWRSSVEVPGVLDLVRAPGGSVVYATSSEPGQPGTVWTLHVSAAHDLHVEEVRELSGELPCSVTVAVDTQDLIVCNYLGGTVDFMRLTGDSIEGAGDRSVDLAVVHREPASTSFPDRQRLAHPHHALWVPERQHALICDLGSDAIVTVEFSRGPAEIVDVLRLTSGSGPRNGVLLSSGRVLVACELDSTIRELSWNGKRYEQTDSSPSTSSTMRENYAGALAASSEHGIAVVANRGASTLGVFDIREPGLRFVEEMSSGGRWPTGLTWAGRHLLVTHEHSESIEIFEVTDRRLTLVKSLDSLPAPKAVLAL